MALSGQGGHQTSHFQRLQGITPPQIALDASPLQGLLESIGREDAKNDRDTRGPGDGSDTLADFRNHHIKVGGVSPDDGPQGDHHLIPPAGRHFLGHQGNFKTPRNPGHIQLRALGGGIDAMPGKAIQAAAEKLACDQVIEASDHQGDAQARDGGERSLVDGQCSDHEIAHAPVQQHQPDPGQPPDEDQSVGTAHVFTAGVEHRHSHDQRKREHHKGKNGERVDDLHGVKGAPADSGTGRILTRRPR